MKSVRSFWIVGIRIRTPNVNTWDTYYKYEMHTLTSFYVRATNGVYAFHVPYLSSLCRFSGAADVSWNEARRQKRYHRRLTNDNGPGLFVARICCRLRSWTTESSSVLKFLCSLKLFTRMKLVYGCLMGRAYEIRAQWVKNRCIVFFYGWRHLFTCWILFASANTVGQGL